MGAKLCSGTFILIKKQLDTHFSATVFIITNVMMTSIC
jgi:hypothetical protein